MQQLLSVSTPVPARLVPTTPVEGRSGEEVNWTRDTQGEGGASPGSIRDTDGVTRDHQGELIYGEESRTVEVHEQKGSG